MISFSQRSTQKELMDDLECSGEELNQTLRELKTINRWLGGNHVTTKGIQELIKEKGQESYKIVDIGCGGGDMLRVITDWAEMNQISIELEGVDANPNTIQLAKTRLSDKPSIVLSVQNVFDEEFKKDRADIATCTLFTHHFTDEELVELLRVFKEKVSLGIVINDLHRHPFAYYSIQTLTKIFSKSKMVRNDAPLSVLRSFSKKDWQRILEKAGIKNYSLRWFWAFRWQLLIYV
ncbi:methyltransferase domain-containing protein [Algoriphagus kandeliae]|uniref:Methyltransferase domain-containing protein n=1 Tax=Algoriphagus kandeliae TaxID=2562278 RepID=A0A4Y9QSP7_9BACT|nr:methyltransferase domain-containing protein [Algoriphagus kandeliae]TFV95504.1 methyltransferase domain-containing protein [Algoriphagus kandeliae]